MASVHPCRSLTCNRVSTCLVLSWCRTCLCLFVHGPTFLHFFVLKCMYFTSIASGTFLSRESDMYLVGDEFWYHILSCSDRCIRDSTLYDARSTCEALHTVQGLLAMGLRPPPTCAHPSERDTGMTRASTTRGGHHLIYRDAHLCSTIAFIYASRLRSHQTRRRGRGRRVKKNTKQNKTRKGK